MTIYTHPDDIYLDATVLIADIGLGGAHAAAVQELRDEIRRLRAQRSALAAALDRIDRGDGGDPVSIAAAAIAAAGLTRENQTTGGAR